MNSPHSTASQSQNFIIIEVPYIVVFSHFLVDPGTDDGSGVYQKMRENDNVGNLYNNEILAL